MPMSPEYSNGSSKRRIKRRKRRRSFFKLPPQRVVVLCLPATILLGVWVILLRRVNIHTDQVVSPERLDPLLPGMPIVVEHNAGVNEKEAPHHQPNHGANENASHGTNKNKGNQKNTVDKNGPAEKLRKPLYIVEAVDEEQDAAAVDDEAKPRHVIPNVITFTHSTNLLNTTIKVTGEDVALQRNVRNTVKLHPGATIHFLTDDKCVDAIKRVMGNDSPLVDFFRSETHGMYKADICRGASLYETGGLYFDVDLQVRMNLFDAISPDTTFVTPLVHRQSKHPGGFFQAFIGVTPQNPIIMRYLELFIKHYQGHVDVQGPLGVLLLRKAHDEIMHGEKRHSDQHVQLWQEILYNKQAFPNVPPPSWGTRRACHFVVVANRKRPFVVPLYSRVKGSRMCGGKESVKNLRGG